MASGDESIVVTGLHALFVYQMFTYQHSLNFQALKHTVKIIASRKYIKFPYQQKFGVNIADSVHI